MGVLVFAAFVTCVPVSFAGGLAVQQRNRGVVVSVDGPRDFTIRRDHRLYEIRLGEINTPVGATLTRRAECGADLVTAGLRRLAPKGRRLSVFISGEKENGRFLGDAQPANRAGETDPSFSSTLIARGLAREGLPQSINAHAIPNANTLDLEYVADSGVAEWLGDDVSHARAHRGVWGACNDRFHLPGGVKPPAIRAATWRITPDGQTTAVGALALPTTTRPAQVLTFTDVAKAYPDLEIVRAYDGLCVGTSAQSGLWFQGVQGNQSVGRRHRHPCAVQRVRGITSLDISTTSSGPSVGDPAADLLVAFPQRLIRDRDKYYAELDGSDASETSEGQPCDASPEGRWRTAATLHDGRISGWFTRLPARC